MAAAKKPYTNQKKYNCAQCNTERSKPASLVTGKDNFCDMACRASWMKGKCTNTGRTHIKKGQRIGVGTEFKKGYTSDRKGKTSGEIWGKEKSENMRAKYLVSRNFKGDGINKNGYRIIKVGTRYKNEHDVVWARHNQLGCIPSGMVVHHINGKKLDNRPENLTLLPNGYHVALHHAIKNSQGRLKLPEV